MLLLIDYLVPLAVKPRPLRSFSGDDFGIILDVDDPAGGKRLIEAYAHSTPLSKFIKCQIADEPIDWPESRGERRVAANSLRSELRAKMLVREPTKGAVQIIILDGPPIRLPDRPYLFLAEIYEWTPTISWYRFAVAS